jgi:signal transduction histidine kinase
VLVLAPLGRDGEAVAELLRRAGAEARVLGRVSDLVASLDAGAEAAVVAEEALLREPAGKLEAWVARQPPWSDLPFVVLTSHDARPAAAAARERLVRRLGSVSLLERPVQTITLASTVQAAVRARRRQYEVRTYLAEREAAARDLEVVVAERTRELEEANRALREEMEERARAEEALRQSQRIEALGQLTGGVAHDFNNLLMVISAGLDMIERQTDPARRQWLLQGMRQSAERGATLTRQLLAFSRRQALRPEPIDLARQIGGMGELLDRSLGGDVSVALDFAPDLWPVEADAGELGLVVLILAVNARDAMPDGGTIAIRAENAPGLDDGELCGDFVRLAIVDTGTGMPPEVRARVFEPFFTTKDVGKGSGLGLAQVYGFARQSGGTVRIDSRPGRGTTVTLLLPRSSRAEALEEQCPAEAVGTSVHPGGTAARHVLLVEDDDEVAALVTEMLAQLGFEVTRAASSRAALGALANGRAVDLVFSDILMPGGMNGLDLAREVRRRRPGLPVLLTTGYAGSALRVAEAEGVAVLAKPYRVEVLAAAVRAALGR